MNLFLLSCQDNAKENIGVLKVISSTSRAPAGCSYSKAGVAVNSLARLKMFVTSDNFSKCMLIYAMMGNDCNKLHPERIKNGTVCQDSTKCIDFTYQLTLRDYEFAISERQ